VPPLCFCVAFSPLCHTHTHTHSLSLFPLSSLFCSGRATNNCGPLYFSLHCTISDRCALVLTAFLPSYSLNSRVDHSSIVQIGCPSEAVSLFRFAVSLFIPYYFQVILLCLWQLYTPHSASILGLPSRFIWNAFPPSCKDIHPNHATTLPWPTGAHLLGAESTSRSFTTLSTGHQPGLWKMKTTSQTTSTISGP